MGSIKNFFKHLFFVPRCAVCGREPEGDGCLCRFCHDRYTAEKRITCPICHYRFSDCRCRAQFASPYINGYARVTHYREEKAAGRLVLSAKDRANKELNRFLASEMAQSVRKRGFCPDVLTFIPCSERSLRQKGFDHGEELAKALGAELGVPVLTCFVRKPGDEQKQLTAERRLENSKNSLFPRAKAADAIKGKHVLLVDDIMTTGASALVASVHLNEMGAGQIDFVCFGSR